MSMADGNAETPAALRGSTKYGSNAQATRKNCFFQRHQTIPPSRSRPNNVNKEAGARNSSYNDVNGRPLYAPVFRADRKGADPCCASTVPHQGAVNARVPAATAPAKNVFFQVRPWKIQTSAQPVAVARTISGWLNTAREQDKTANRIFFQVGVSRSCRPCRSQGQKRRPQMNASGPRP